MCSIARSNPHQIFLPIMVIHDTMSEVSFSISTFILLPHLVISWITRELFNKEELVKISAKRNASESQINDGKEELSDGRPNIGFCDLKKRRNYSQRSVSIGDSRQSSNSVVPRIMIEGKSSCDIMYDCLYKKLRLHKWDYHLTKA